MSQGSDIGSLAPGTGAVFPRAKKVGDAEGFYLEEQDCSVVYRDRGPGLLVSFCNLASFEHPVEKRLPWLSHHAEAKGWSHLGVMAHRKDWYRNPGTPALLQGLSEDGFFRTFDRVLFSGTSMGAFAALVYASVAPGSDVLAFSPQSTLNTDLAPFETRYRWPRRKFNWSDREWLDAADYVGASRHAVIAFDPMLALDKAHVARLGAGSVEVLSCRFMGHQLPNALKRAGVLEDLLRMSMEGSVDRVDFYNAFRTGRKAMVDWRKAMVRHAIEQGHPVRARRICLLALNEGPGPWFRRILDRLGSNDILGEAS